MIERRIEFKKYNQKKFLKKCIKNLNCLSLRGLLQFGIKTNYNNLKNYYSERRLIPENLFNDLLILSKIESNKLNIKIKKQNWGQINGGKLSKRIKTK